MSFSLPSRALRGNIARPRAQAMLLVESKPFNIYLCQLPDLGPKTTIRAIPQFENSVQLTTRCRKDRWVLAILNQDRDQTPPLRRIPQAVCVNFPPSPLPRIISPPNVTNAKRV